MILYSFGGWRAWVTMIIFLALASCASTGSGKSGGARKKAVAAPAESEKKIPPESAEPTAPAEPESGAIPAPTAGESQKGEPTPEESPIATEKKESEALIAPSEDSQAPVEVEIRPEEKPETVKAESTEAKKAIVDDKALPLIGALGGEILGVAGAAGEAGKMLMEKGKGAITAAGTMGKELAIAAGEKGKELAIAAGEKGIELAVAAGEKGKEIAIKAERMIDEQHDWFSGELESTVVLVDRYFDNENSKVEENHTQLKASLSGFYEEGSDVQPGLGLDAKLVLPRFEKRVHIILTGDSEDTGVVSSKAAGHDSSETKPKPENLPKSAAIRYFLIAVDKQNLSVDGGANLKGLTPVFFGSGRYRLNVDLNSWDMRFTQWAKWFTDTGTALTARFEFEQLLREDWLFRGTAEGSWYEQEMGYFYLGKLEAYHTVNPKSVLQYSAGANFRTWPENRLTNTTIRALHRRNMWREWFFLEGVLQGSWPEENKYGFVPAAGLKMDMFFGRKYRKINGAR